MSTILPGQARSTEDLLAYCGCYRFDEDRLRVISYRQGPDGQGILLFNDLGSDAIRAMSPTGPDRFQFGPALLQLEPTVASVGFAEALDGEYTVMRYQEGNGQVELGVRIGIRREDFRFHRADLEFEGTLYLPEGTQPAATIILIPGSEGSGVRQNFDAYPWVMAKAGFVVLAYDKRGTGKSGGSWHVSLEVLAADVVAGLEKLREHERVDETKMGAFGFSEGGWVAPLAARLDGGLSFIVAQSGGGMTKGDSFVEKHRRRFVEAGLEGAGLESALQEKREIIAASEAKVKAGNPKPFDARVSYDPRADWLLFDGAVLAIMGEVDVLQDTP
ncbi:MAG: alpha/beta hydrolase family protein, partial [Planctomycetota bacterium]